jgi:hypothetical protein
MSGFANRYLPIVLAGLLAFQIGCPPAAGAAIVLPECSSNQLLGHVPDEDEVAAHRRFKLPVISYPAGTHPESMGWGFKLTLRIDPNGQVVCFSRKGESGLQIPLNSVRGQVMAGLGQCRYAPFASEGRAATAVATENIREEELPPKREILPDVPLNKISIALERTGCYGRCPHYLAIARGDGTAEYRGEGFSDVHGKHTYRIEKELVGKLVDDIRKNDLWSMRPAYRGGITDQSSYVLVLNFGAQSHTIVDYAGDMAGMPATIKVIEGEVDKIARSDQWLHLSREAINHLRQEHFPFRSREGADLLARAVANDETTDDGAIAELIGLGAPIGGGRLPLPSAARSLVEMALLNHRTAVIDALIAKGALKSKGHPDQRAVDVAFRAAIEGGRLALVQRIWNVPENGAHPALGFVSESGFRAAKVRRKSPVTLLLSHDAMYEHGTPWDGLEIARWLAVQGCDLKASDAEGKTLLHIAAAADDAKFVAWLLAQGLDRSGPDGDGNIAAESTSDEDVAMLLLAPDTHFMDADHSFRQDAERRGWKRVLAWLDAHHM